MYIFMSAFVAVSVFKKVDGKEEGLKGGTLAYQLKT